MLRFSLSYSSSPGFNFFLGLYTAGFNSAIRRRSCFIAAAFCKTSSCGVGPALPGLPSRYHVFRCHAPLSLRYKKDHPAAKCNEMVKKFSSKTRRFLGSLAPQASNSRGSTYAPPHCRLFSRVCHFSSYVV